MWESKFESIGEDLMVEVFVIVGQNYLKAVLRLRCVSKLWRTLVNSRCLHRLTYNDPLELKGQLMKLEFGNLVKIQYPPLLAYTAHHCHGGDINNHLFGQEEEEGLLEKFKMDEDSSRGFVFLDACNGLLLHRLNNNNNNKPSSPPVYRVSNLETNSCVMVNGEADTADSMCNKMDHATLAYDPVESLVSFKIVAFFQRLTPPADNYLHHKCMRIYSSKTGKWSPDLNFDHLLDFSITSHRWLQQSIYLNGATYRLPIAGYLLRFEEITDEGNCHECRVQAIQLPKATRLFLVNPIHVGINKGQINLALSTIFYGSLKVWVLQEEGHVNSYNSYQWILKHHICNLEIPARLVLNVPPARIRLLGFHPYEDAVLLFAVDDFHFRFICCHLDKNLCIASSNYQAILDTLPQDVVVRPYSFPIFSCAVPLQ